MPKNLRLWQPNGGEKWGINKAEKITWLSESLSGDIRLDLYRKGKLVGPIKTGVPVKDGAWEWSKVGDLENGEKAQAANDYTVRICMMDGSLQDESDGLFTIIIQTGNFIKPTITSPNGGEIWTFENEHKIVWIYKQISSSVKLELLQNHQLLGTISEKVPITDGFFNWKVGQYKDALNRILIARPGKDYTIRISTLDKAFTDDSDSPFRIEHSLNLIYPNGGETFSYSPPPISWEHHEIGNDKHKIELLQNDKVIGLISDSVNINWGRYHWNGELKKPKKQVEDGSGFKILISSITDSKNRAISAKPFNIALAKISLRKIDSYVLLGTKIKIAWMYNNIDSEKGIYLKLIFNNKELGYLTKKMIPITDGSFEWDVGKYYKYQNSPLPEIGYLETGGYRIKLIVDGILGTEDGGFSSNCLFSWSDPFIIYHEQIGILKERKQIALTIRDKNWIPLMPGNPFLSYPVKLDTEGTASYENGKSSIVGVTNNIKRDLIAGFLIESASTVIFSAYLKFDIDKIPSWVEVESATISLMVVNSVVKYFDFKKYFRTSDPRLLWEFLLCNKPLDLNSGDCDATPVPGIQTISWNDNCGIIDITEIVRSWRIGTRINCGLILVCPLIKFLFNTLDFVDDSSVLLEIVLTAGVKVKPMSIDIGEPPRKPL